MDEMRVNLSSKFMRNLVSKLLSKMIYKKTGYKVDIRIDKFNASVVNGEAHVSAGIEAKLNADEFTKIMNSIDL